MEILKTLFPLFISIHLNKFIFVLICLTLGIMFRIRVNRNKIKKLYKIEPAQVKERVRREKFKFNYFKTLETKINRYYYFKKNSHNAQYLYIGVLALELIIFLVCLNYNKVIFAVVIPPMIHFFTIKALDLLTVNIHNIIQEELPHVIKHMVKVFSKTNDLKTVFYETSKNLKGPMREMFFDLSRKMISENYEKSLMDFADSVDNIWIHSFTFLMMSYKEQSRKEDIIKNLRSLADILDKENYIKEKGLTDKKPMALMNYILVIASFALFVVNLACNDHAMTFFFDSILGMICFVAGFGSMLLTILVNLMLTNKSERG